MKKSLAEDIQQQLSRFLFHYRATSHIVTGVSPAHVLMGRTLRTHLYLMHVASCTARAQARQKADSAGTGRLNWELGCLSNTSLQALNGYLDASEPYAGLCCLMWSWIMAEL